MPFPFIDITSKDTPVKPWTPPKEFECDLATGRLIIRDGSISIIEGLPALRIWIRRCLLTVRGRFDAYSWDYGVDIESLYQSGHTREALLSEAKRMVKEALMMNPHILDVTDFTLSLYDNKLDIRFTAVTDCGSAPITF